MAASILFCDMIWAPVPGILLENPGPVRTGPLPGRSRIGPS